MADATPSSPAPASAPAVFAAPAAPAASEPSAATPSHVPSRDTPAAASGDWPADWRERLSGGDEKKLNALRRYASPQAYSDAGFQLRHLMDSKQLKAPLPAHATREEVALWRRENGIPETPEGYLAKLDRGIIVGAGDRAIVAKFLDSMHARNATPEVVNAALGTYYQIQEMLQTEQLAQDDRAKQAAEDTLRPEWGPGYRRNINAILGYLDTAPPGVKDALMNARLADGTPLASNANMLRFLLGSAQSANPAATVAPGAPGASAQSLDTRIAEIEKLMRDNRAEYNRNGAMQEEYLQLLRARDKHRGGG
jgi:hypothetical protein